jgi:hypothetical protein
MAWRSMLPNQTSTRFCQEAWVGVKCTTNRRFASNRRFAVVVDNMAVGPFDLLEEGQGLLVSVPQL